MTSQVLSVFFIFFVSSIVFAQTIKSTDSITTDNPCYQKRSERLEFIKKADSNPLVVNRINFTGNKTLRDRFFRENLVFKEGDVFSKKLLNRSIGNLNKLKEIQPVTINNLRIKIDSQNRDVELLFCVVEKPHLN